MGTAHTQWWDHDTGEIARMANALAASAKSGTARRMVIAASARTTPAPKSHTPVRIGGSRPKRASTANRDWFPA
jgi:hypothetical protein